MDRKPNRDQISVDDFISCTTIILDELLGALLHDYPFQSAPTYPLYQ